MDSDSLYASALTTIESAQLSAFEHLQLKSFLIHAVVESEAARFILRASQTLEGDVEDTLRSITSNLKILARKCMRNFPHPESPLDHFLIYLSIVSHNGAVSPDVDSALREREKGRCCISGCDSGLRATHIVPPSILDDEDLHPGVTPLSSFR